MNRKTEFYIITSGYTVTLKLHTVFFTVNINTMKLLHPMYILNRTEINKQLPQVKHGGSWLPLTCKPTLNVAIIIWYINMDAIKLQSLLLVLHRSMQSLTLGYRVYVMHKNQNQPNMTGIKSTYSILRTSLNHNVLKELSSDEEYACNAAYNLESWDGNNYGNDNQFSSFLNDVVSCSSRFNKSSSKPTLAANTKNTPIVKHVVLHQLFTWLILHPSDSAHLEASSQKPVTKVVLFAYMRGGSSFLGELINQNPDGFYVFEPLPSLYSHLYGLKSPNNMHVSLYWDNIQREIPPFEEEAVTEFLTDILNCNLMKLPTEFFVHMFRFWHNYPSMKPLKQCLKNKNTDVEACKYETNLNYINKCRGRNLYFCYENFLKVRHKGLEFHNDIFKKHDDCVYNVRKSIEPCIEALQESCKGSTIRGIKVIRLFMEATQTLLASDKDIQIVHLTRDPRGRFASNTTGKNVEFANYHVLHLCTKVLHDVNMRQLLEYAYPGSYMQLRYEDMAVRPLDIAHQVYSYLGMEVPDEVTNWLSMATKAGRDNGASGTSRRNSTQEAYDWKTKVPAAIQKHVLTLPDCRAVIYMLGYPH